MSDKTEVIQTTEEKSEKESSSSSINNVNTSTPVRLFGQFRSTGTGFGSFGQSSLNGESSSTSLFTSTLSKLSTTNNSVGFGSLATNGTSGFGSTSTSLAASLAPLSSNKTLFFEASTTMKSNEDETKKNGEEGNDDDDEEKDGGDDDDDDDNDADDEDETTKTTPSLFETAAEYEAKRASTHPMANIQGDTSTGEEHEVTKFQMAGKLFMYNSEQQQFVERGYGILKINESHDPSDWNKLQARIIMRLDKAFRVILNSPIFPKMTVERATDRSVRFGAQDESHLRVFVIKATPSDCSNLIRELQSRIEIIERQHSSPFKNPSDSPSAENLPVRIRKRSHSKSDSDTSENNNDLSKKSKFNQENQDTTDEDSVESIKTGEQASSD